MDIDKIYAQKRERQYAQRMKRLARANAEIPELEALMAEYRKLLAMRAEGGEAAQNAAELLEINKKARSELLAARGFAPDYTDAQYDCAVCRDYGVLEGGKRCACRLAIETQKYREVSGFNAAQTFAAFNESVFPDDGQREMMKKLRQSAMEYANAVPKSLIKNFLTTGGTGLGKTFLLNCMGNTLLERGVNARYITAYEYQRIIMDGVVKNGDSTELSALLSCEFLALDDMGAESKINNITEPYMFTLVDTRLNNGRYTAFATNLSPEGLKERYGERTFSRLVNPAASYLKKLAGRDVRHNKLT